VAVAVEEQRIVVGTPEDSRLDDDSEDEHDAEAYGRAGKRG
jgi:hypothetical protein